MNVHLKYMQKLQFQWVRVNEKVNVIVRHYLDRVPDPDLDLDLDLDDEDDERDEPDDDLDATLLRLFAGDRDRDDLM